MDCNFEFCIYQNNGRCTTEDIEINVLGQCDGIEIVDIPQKTLSYHKNKILTKYDEIHKKWDEESKKR